MTDAERADLHKRLVEAEKALHRLQIGQSATLVKTSDYQTEFKPAEINLLRAYIEELRDVLHGGRRRRGALGFVLSIALAFALLGNGAHAQAAVTKRADGPDLPYPCWLVRIYAALYTAAQLTDMARAHHIVLTPKQLRQARECLK